MNTAAAIQFKEDLAFEKFPAVELLFHLLCEREVDLDIRDCQQGVEIHIKNQILENENRGYLRIFFPTPSKCVLFFHKKSQVPFSRDRFSYGGLIIDEKSTSRYSVTDVEEWVEFLFSGLQPGKRPSSLKKSIPYTIPDDLKKNNNISISAVCENEHDALDKIFEEYQNYKRTDLIRARKRLLVLKSRLERHLLCEEKIIFPLYERRFRTEQRPTDVLREENHRVRELINLLDGHKPLNNHYEKLLLIILGQHYVKEESAILPALDQILTGDEKADLFQKIQDASCGYFEAQQIEPEAPLHEESSFPIILP